MEWCVPRGTTLRCTHIAWKGHCRRRRGSWNEREVAKVAWEAGSWDEGDGSWDGEILPRNVFNTPSQRFSLFGLFRTRNVSAYKSDSIYPKRFHASKYFTLTVLFPVSRILSFPGIFPTFRLQSRFLELIRSFGLIQIRFAYIPGTIHISAVRSKRRRIYELGWLLNLGLLRVVGMDSGIRI